MPAGSPPGDAFEAAEMLDGARVVRRDKVISRLMATILAIPGLGVIGLSAFIALTNATAQKPVPAAALPLVVAAMIAFGVMFLAMSVVFSVLRTVVTEQAVHVRYGLWGPTVPIENIRGCRAVAYDWTRFGGWGIRRSRDGVWAYVPTAPGKVLELTFVEGARERRILVGALNAEETVRQIEQLRATRAAGGKRVAASPASADATAPGEASDVIDEEFTAESKRSAR